MIWDQMICMHPYLVGNVDPFFLPPLYCLMDEVCNFLDEFSWSSDFSTHMGFTYEANVFDLFIAQPEPLGNK